MNWLHSWKELLQTVNKESKKGLQEYRNSMEYWEIMKKIKKFKKENREKEFFQNYIQDQGIITHLNRLWAIQNIDIEDVLYPLKEIEKFFDQEQVKEFKKILFLIYGCTKIDKSQKTFLIGELIDSELVNVKKQLHSELKK